MIDHVRIEVRAGAGGDGCPSFRREAHVPKGGPDGGDGGRGGDVVLVCEDSLRDLEAFRRRAHFRAARGGHGQGALRHGADGEALVVRVPPGTQVVAEDGARWDLVRPGQRAVVARGGPGGRGNKHFAGPTRQAPRLAEHDPRLAALPRLLALSKADLVPAQRAAAAAREWTGGLGDDVPVILTSSATGAGIDALAAELARRVPIAEAAGDGAGTEAEPGAGELPQHRTVRPSPRRGFAVQRVGGGAVRVTRAGIAPPVPAPRRTRIRGRARGGGGVSRHRRGHRPPRRAL